MAEEARAVSSTYSLEQELRDKGDQLMEEGYRLKEVADLLEELRTDKERSARIKELKDRAKGYL